MNIGWSRAVLSLKNGGIAVIPTDTIYGIVASAHNKKSVERLYNIRGRNPKKPCIIMCSSIQDLSSLGINIDEQADIKLLSKIWPNPVSVILPCPNNNFSYLHKGTKTLAIRIPKDLKLLEFIKKVGPIIAPSANLEGMAPAKNIKEAKSYFGKKVNIYIDGKVSNKPSTIISLVDGKVKVIRNGAFRISSKFQKTISKRL